MIKSGLNSNKDGMQYHYLRQAPNCLHGLASLDNLETDETAWKDPKVKQKNI